MTRQTLLDGLGFRFVGTGIARPLLLFRQASLRVEFLQLRLQRFHFLRRKKAGVVAVLVIFLIRRREHGRQLGHPQTLLFHLDQQFGKLAFEQLAVGDQFRPPATGSNRFQVGLQVIHVAGEGAADLVIVK